MEFIFITNDPNVASTMALAGVDRIMVDLEINGKIKRQGHLDTVISCHTFEDISEIRQCLDRCNVSSLMVRINPLHDGSESEIDQVISRGADRIMLPMFTHPDEVSRCIELIRGRVPLTLLLETSAALARLPQILDVSGFDDIHIGLNDLHLDMGLDFMFELFSSGLLDHVAKLIRASGHCFGIGGVSALGSGLIPAHLILAAHIELGSERVILSRSFANFLDDNFCAAHEIQRLKNFILQDDLNLPSLIRELHLRILDVAAENRLGTPDSL